MVLVASNYKYELEENTAGNFYWTDTLHHPKEDLKGLGRKNIPSQLYQKEKQLYHDTKTREKIGTVFLSYKRDIVSWRHFLFYLCSHGSPSNSVLTNPAKLNPHASRELKHPR